MDPMKVNAKGLSVGVLTVDDHPVFRRAAREVIEATAGFESLGEAASGVEALVLAAEVSPSLVLVDVRMPGMNGLETSRRLHVSHPEAVIVLITTEANVELDGCGAVALICKKDFGSAALVQLWREHGDGHWPPLAPDS
jgi:two-component system, NarL family, invasion response regulator UvrY